MMRSYLQSLPLPLLTVFVLLVCANASIVFHPAPLRCDPILPTFQGCLRGQRCNRHGFCEIPLNQNEPSESDASIGNRGRRNLASRRIINGSNIPELGKFPENDKFSETRVNLDAAGEAHEHNFAASYHAGKENPPYKVNKNEAVEEDPVLCGASNNDKICTNNSCCSPYGYCGDTISHCGAGCQSGPCKFAHQMSAKEFAPFHQELPGGSFEYVSDSGVPVMHAVVMPNGKVMFLDKIENYTQLKLPSTGQYAYSAEYDPDTRELVPLALKTNPFCSGGIFLADGRLVNVGGNGPLSWLDPTVEDGFKGIRFLRRDINGSSFDGSDWEEPGTQMTSARWYPSCQILANGHIFIIAGSLNALDPLNPLNNNPTYEMLDADGRPYGRSIVHPLLEKNQPYYMYPFLHLLPDGSMFIFAARSSELFDVMGQRTLKTFPDLLGDYRIYPNTGSSVLLPLDPENNYEPEVIVCGGGSYVHITSPTEASCGRIKPFDQDPEWQMELMPKPRTMLDAILLPDGTIMWVNGCSRGAQGFGIAKDPVYDAWIYDPKAPSRQRWYISGSTTIARMYHSVALLLLDGTVMVTGSNPVEMPMLVAQTDKPEFAFPTEFSVEIYTPPYLAKGNNARDRPDKVWLSTDMLRPDGQTFTVSFDTHGNLTNEVKIVLLYGGFVTHSLHMGQRMIYLRNWGYEPGVTGKQQLVVQMPDNENVVPPGPYAIHVVVDGVPSVGKIVMVAMIDPNGEGEESRGGTDTEIEELERMAEEYLAFNEKLKNESQREAKE